MLRAILDLLLLSQVFLGFKDLVGQMSPRLLFRSDLALLQGVDLRVAVLLPLVEVLAQLGRVAFQNSLLDFVVLPDSEGVGLCSPPLEVADDLLGVHGLDSLSSKVLGLEGSLSGPLIDLLPDLFLQRQLHFIQFLMSLFKLPCFLVLSERIEATLLEPGLVLIDHGASSQVGLEEEPPLVVVVLPGLEDMELPRELLPSTLRGVEFEILKNAGLVVLNRIFTSQHPETDLGVHVVGVADPGVESVVQLVEVLAPDDLLQLGLLGVQAVGLVSPNGEITLFFDLCVSLEVVPEHLNCLIFVFVNFNFLFVEFKPLVEHPRLQVVSNSLIGQFPTNFHLLSGVQSMLPPLL
jgi:hypothetical protein